MNIYKTIINIRQYCLTASKAYVQVCDWFSYKVSDAITALTILILYLPILPLWIIGNIAYRIVDKYTIVQEFWEDYNDFVKQKKEQNK